MQVRDGYGYLYQAFNVGTRDPNTDPYVCEASTWAIFPGLGPMTFKILVYTRNIGSIEKGSSA